MHDIETDERCLATRQIAILLQSLPARTHRVLVGQLDQDDKHEINQQLELLGDADPLEQYRVMKRLREQLKAGTSDAERVESEIQDEIQIGRARVSRKRRNGNYRPSERPTMTNEESASNRISSDQMAPGEQDDSEPVYQVSSIRLSDFYQSQAVGVMPASALFGGINDEDAEPVRLPIRSAPTPSRVTQHRDGSNRQKSTAGLSATEAELIQRVDQFLQQLSPSDLCRALAMVTTRQAFLVLCGLPNEKAETVLGLLPRRKAKQVRNDMRTLGPLQLSDIDAAKRKLAEVALELQSEPLSVAA
ncbi:FliG C-terminal domain-containing protein [Rhodopirellula sp. MGV]|uniref:FliG C-terminal domain-containing protein n=1 Tax=Rhodopirellula sp. MGV TaxID=2023130 RepID=UPI001304046F|nr:FliG C-terminal domain-containing protein [Rhodopirellula sp. MGV]